LRTPPRARRCSPPRSRPGPPPEVATAADDDGSVLSPKVERVELSNGLVVLLHEDHSVPVVTFWQWYRVGSRNERPGITGISHVFEHMMFNGSKNVAPKEYDRILESNGGLSNAFTSRDMTAYYEDVASDRLDVIFRLDSDRMTELSLEPKPLESEMGVVKEERRSSTDNDIFGMLDEQLWAVAFNASPYRWPVIGWMGDLNRLQRTELQEYFRTYYAPNNCILVLTGDFVPAQALASIRKYFEGIPRQTPPAPPVNSEPEQRGERRVDVRYPAQSVSFIAGYKAPNAKSDDYYALRVLEQILSNGESSRLHRSLVYDKQLALGVDTEYEASLDPTLFLVYVALQPGKTAADGEQAMDEVIAGLVADGPSATELSKAKNLLEAEFVKQLETNNGVGQELAYYEHIFGDYQALFGVLDRYRAVTAMTPAHGGSSI
jgi:predicted Zn-dependent peptidase